jgi:dephospho-CoA kinase
MENKIILGIVGEIAAGKGTVAQYLEKKYHASIFRFSTILRDVLDRIHVDQTRQNMQLISLVLRQNFGENLFAKVIAEDVKNTHNNIVVVDGIRRFADIEYLEKLPEFILIYVTADIKIRYSRIIRRSENTDDNNKTFEQFLADHQAETELAIPKIGSKAKYKIENSGDLEKLKRQIELIIK